MLHKKKAGLLSQLESFITPLSEDAEGKLRGGFGGITEVMSTAAYNADCSNPSCTNGRCTNAGKCDNGKCTNGDCTNTDDCINHVCSDSTSTKEPTSPKPAFGLLL